MPLLKRQPFRKQKPPEDLAPEEELFYCKLTKEIFRDYEEFFERVILCNSLVWTCELTGRPGLTYAEALESEKKAQNILKTFPVPLKRPVLYLGNLTKRGRLVDMCDDVFVFAKDRYFIGEEVEALIDNQKLNSHITKVIPPSSDEINNLQRTVHSSPETSTSSDDNEKKKTFGPDPSLYKYEIKVNKKENHLLPAASITRKKGQFSKEKIKLFLKQYFEPKDNLWKLQEMFNKKYNISSMKFTDIFAGPLPSFEKTIGKKNSPHPSTAKSDSPETNAKHKTPNESKMHQKVNKKEASQQIKKEITIEDVEELRRTFEERRRLKEEEKLKKKAEKEKERERLREERRIQMEQLKEWLKPRDDLECDDLKDIPVPAAVQCSIPNELFGKALMILEYLHIFGHLFRIKDTFSQGFTFELLERCLLEKDVQGPLGDILQFLLQAIFNLQASEENVNIVTSESIEFLDFDEDTDGNVTRILQAATAVSTWPQRHQGMSLQKLPLDCYTLTEILRLHLLTLGGQAANANWQQQVKGSYSVRDDPALELRLKDPNLIKALGMHSVFDLNPAERLQLMEVLINQLLTFLTVREEIEEKLEKAKVARMELKQFQWAEQRREKEEAALFKNKILNLQQSEKEENATPDEKTSVLDIKEDPESPTNGLSVKLKERNEAYLQRKRENYLKREQELIETMNKLQSGGAIQSLGRDRAYRRFWTFTSIPGLFVEDDDDFIGTCLSEPTPYNPNGNPYSQLNGASEYHKHSKMNGQLTSDKENKVFENQTNPTNENSVTYNKKHKLLSDNHPSVVLERINHVASIKEEPVTASDVSNKLQIFGMCTASSDHCPVHGKIRNQNKIYWSFYCTSTEVDDLITCLNPRGYREGPLRETLLLEKQRIIQSFDKCPIQKLNSERAADLQIQDIRKSNRLNYTSSPLVLVDVQSEEMMESALREMLLDIEERLYAGSLGWIKIPDRNAWREAILNKSYASQCETLRWGRNKGKSCENITENGRITPLDNSYQETNSQRTFSPLPVSQPVKDMAAALLQIAQSIELKYIQRPLGENDDDRKQRLRSIEELEKKMKEENSENNETKKEMLQKLQSPNNVMELWEESLMLCTSFSQIFLHLATLENSIAWSRSALNAKCRLCRRMGDAENMLLCDGCNRGHHTYCLKPPLKEIPEGDWFCKDCKPKTEVHSILKRMSVVLSDIDESSKQTMSDMANDPDYDDEMEKMYINDDSESSNADTCDVCGKGGHLICCDYCPLSFHMGCVQPPLKKVPRGRWECPHCSQVTPRSRRKRTSDIESCESPAKRTRSRDKPPVEEEDEIWMSGRKKQGPPNRRGASRDVPVDYKLCDQVLVELCRHECSWPFLRPVKQKEAPQYYDIIKRPIDLATMRKKLSNMEYRATRDFLADIFLLMQNCMMYNAVDSPEYIAATGLLEFVEKLVQHLGYVDLEDLLYQACQNIGSPVSSENSSQDKNFNKSSLRYS